MRHLETAMALISQLDRDEALSVVDRHQLGGVAAETGVLVDHLARAVAGEDLEEELVRLFAEVDEQIRE